ncbi:MAG: TIM barrel protein [Erysipelotrichaceae bacterium]|nr:TIM barrel protein [Erysipelotrichaceae bacterium]
MKTYVQQIVLGSIIKNEEQTSALLKQIKEAGYTGLELNHFMIHHSPLAVKILTGLFGMPAGKSGDLNWFKMVTENDIEVISLHVDLGSLEKDVKGICEQAKQLSAKYIVITGMYRYDYQDEDKVLELANRLNAAGKAVKENGLELLYHNHNVELLKTKSGKCAYEILIEKTDPEYLNFEFDSYWFTDGGADAMQWMKKLGKRMKLWHIADRGSRLKKLPMTPIIKSDVLELGAGNMDLLGMKQIAIENETEAVILECHRNFVDKDPLKCIQLSGEWLKENL